MRSSEKKAARPKAAPGRPVLSVVVIIGSCRERAEYLLAALAEQTVRDRLEVIVVDLAGDHVHPVDLPPGLEVSRLHLSPFTGWGSARFVGLKEARAPLVAFLEDHCIPEPRWAGSVVGAFDCGAASVGYSFTNGSPDTRLYRSILATEYGAWMDLAQSGPTAHLPANNVAYRAELLRREFGEDLEEALEIDFTIHEVLKQRGHLLWIAADAVVAHQSTAYLRHLFRGHHAFCRLLAARRVRVQRWGRLRRVAHGLVAPVAVPLLRWTRLWTALRGRPGIRRSVVASSPLVLPLFAWAAIGEALGCLFGAGRSSVSLTTMELRWPRATKP
jgi:hypothetical protein